jgi:hypothetical protein
LQLAELDAQGRKGIHGCLLIRPLWRVAPVT